MLQIVFGTALVLAPLVVAWEELFYRAARIYFWNRNRDTQKNIVRLEREIGIDTPTLVRKAAISTVESTNYQQTFYGPNGLWERAARGGFLFEHQVRPNFSPAMSQSASSVPLRLVANGLGRSAAAAELAYEPGAVWKVSDPSDVACLTERVFVSSGGRY